MIAQPEIDLSYPLTDGNIAANNLDSTRQQSWSRFWREPLRSGVAECVVEQEQLAMQFLGDLGALDRLEMLVNHLDRVDTETARTALVHAQIASMTHRFADARSYLAKAEVCGELADAANRLSLSIDQACGTKLGDVLTARRMAAKSGHLEDLVPLGALYADLREFDEADRIYQRALRGYRDTSPFAVAWVCFQLGVLWGELVPEPQHTRAAHWYRKAIEYLPGYLKARVHLAEIYLKCGPIAEAEAVLMPAALADDPEVFWRLADVMVANGKSAVAEELMEAARSRFEFLLERFLLAFADHGAEFYSANGNDAERAFELASVNLANRPTLRAFEQAHATALAAGAYDTASEILSDARKRWGDSTAFTFSPLVERDPGHDSRDKPDLDGATA